MLMKQNSASIKLSIAGVAVELQVTVPDKPVNQELFTNISQAMLLKMQW